MNSSLIKIKLAVEPLEPRHLLAAIAAWADRGIGGGGALFGPAISPHDVDHLYVSSDMSQIFRSDDGGASWATQDFRQLQGGSKPQVQFTSDPNVLYSIDGSPDGPVDQLRPAKSTDGGQTWNALSADPTFGETFSLKADYSNPNRLVVGSWNTLHLSTNGGDSFNEVFSTNDGGGAHLAGAFFDDSNIYLGTNVGLVVSNDGGQTFGLANIEGIPTDERIVSMTGASDDGTARIFVVTMDQNDVWNGVPGSDRYGYRSVYRLDVGDTQWTAVTNGIPDEVDGFFVAASVDDINTVYLAGGDALYPAVYKSTNGGDQWSNVFQTTNNANIETGWSGDSGDEEWWYGETAMGFTIDPVNPDRVMITDFGFAHLTTDGGASWVNLNVDPADRNPAGQNTPQGQSYRGSGLENSVTWDLAWTSPDRMIAAHTDIQGTISDDGGQSWSFDYTGHDQNTMYRVFEHSTSGTTYAATSSIHDLYQSTRIEDYLLDPGEGKILYSLNDGTTWQTLHDFGHIVSWIAEDPTNPNRLYASVVDSTEGGIYVSNDIQNRTGSTWTRLTNPPRTEGHPFNIRVLNDGTLVTSFSARMDPSGAFTPSSGVFVSTDSGQSWSDRSHTDMHYWTKDIIVDPHDATQNTWYAGVWSGWGGPANDRGGLFKSPDRGATWERIFDQHRVSSATISPTDPNEMYLTTEVAGLWHTGNLQSAAPTFEPVTSYGFRQPERVFYNPYDANEVWVSSFGDSLAVGRIGTDTVDGDFNDDGEFDLQDIDALMNVIANQTNDASFDLTADGDIDLADRDAWITAASVSNSPSIYVLGDANLDGAVDSTDLGLLLNSFGEGGGNLSWSRGDFDAGGTIGSTDLGLLLNNFGHASNVAATSATVVDSAESESHSPTSAANVKIAPVARPVLARTSNHFPKSGGSSKLAFPHKVDFSLRDFVFGEEDEEAKPKV